MQEIIGISETIVNKLIKRANSLGQGRSVGTIGFVDSEGYISGFSEIINGGTSGIPFRILLSGITGKKHLSLLEMVNHLPDNSVIISVKPGKTGIIVSTSGINIFDLPIVKIGLKNGQPAGVGLLYPKPELFNLATQSEKARLKSLAALTMEDEKKALRESTELHLKYLDISREIPVVELNSKQASLKPDYQDWELPTPNKVKSISKEFAESLVAKSNKVEQGREVAAFGRINQQGHVEQTGDIIVGGMGYIPSRLLASAYREISSISLREVYTDVISPNSVIVHTHPGGTGVMHISDAMAGPGTWGRSIIAIGHNKKGDIKGGNVVEPSSELFKLADEKEEIDQKFFDVDTSDEEVDIRKRRYEIAQEFTDLCEEIEIA